MYIDSDLQFLCHTYNFLLDQHIDSEELQTINWSSLVNICPLKMCNFQKDRPFQIQILNSLGIIMIFQFGSSLVCGQKHWPKKMLILILLFKFITRSEYILIITFYCCFDCGFLNFLVAQFSAFLSFLHQVQILILMGLLTKSGNDARTSRANWSQTEFLSALVSPELYNLRRKHHCSQKIISPS